MLGQTSGGGPPFCTVRSRRQDPRHVPQGSSSERQSTACPARRLRARRGRRTVPSKVIKSRSRWWLTPFPAVAAATHVAGRHRSQAIGADSISEHQSEQRTYSRRVTDGITKASAYPSWRFAMRGGKGKATLPRNIAHAVAAGTAAAVNAPTTRIPNTQGSMTVALNLTCTSFDRSVRLLRRGRGAVVRSDCHHCCY